MPDRGGTRTLSTLLMACAGVAKPYPPFAEHAAMLDNPTSGPLGGGDAGADAFPLADFRLSPTRDSFVEPMTFDPDTSLSILSLMDAENATEREQNRWDRSAPENYRLGNTTLTGVGKLRFALRKWAAPRRPPEDRTKLILEALPQARLLAQQQRQRLHPAAARLAGGERKRREGRRRGEGGRRHGRRRRSRGGRAAAGDARLRRRVSRRCSVTASCRRWRTLRGDRPREKSARARAIAMEQLKHACELRTAHGLDHPPDCYCKRCCRRLPN